MAKATYEVEAAGGVIWRRASGVLEVLLVHRPRYDDWSFPKGKCDPGERHRETARREVSEEVGLDVEFGRRLSDVRYLDHKGRSKRVKYWAMTSTGGSFAANEEVDVVRWIAADTAADLLTYEHDHGLVGDVLRVLETS